LFDDRARDEVLGVISLGAIDRSPVRFGNRAPAGNQLGTSAPGSLMPSSPELPQGFTNNPCRGRSEGWHQISARVLEVGTDTYTTGHRSGRVCAGRGGGWAERVQQKPLQRPINLFFSTRP